MKLDEKYGKDPVVLLVEDDASDVQLIQVAIKRTPGAIHLVRVEDGDMAIDYLAGNPPYGDREQYPLPVTMILDIKLPKRSGLEVLQWLRSQKQAIRLLPTLMLTSSTHRRDVDRAFENGANGYLAKPESIKELASMLGELKSFWLGCMEFPDLGRLEKTV